MNSITIFKYQKSISFLIGMVGIIGIIISLLSSYLKLDLSYFTIAVYPLFILPFYQYYTFKKNYFRYDNSAIKWRFPHDNKDHKVELLQTNVSVEQDWKGVIIQTNNKKHHISLDGIWKNDRKRIFTELKEYYSVKN